MQPQRHSLSYSDRRQRENAKGTEYGTFAPLVDNVPHYSTGIAAAWEVVDDLAARHFYVCVEHVHKPREQWNAWVGDKNVYAFTAPHAICLAALAALSPADDGGAR